MFVLIRFESNVLNVWVRLGWKGSFYDIGDSVLVFTCFLCCFGLAGCGSVLLLF